MLKEKVEGVDFTVLEQDVTTVLFFNRIYNKADDYFRILRSKIISSLSKSLIDIDSEIAVLQEHQKKLNELHNQCETFQKKAEFFEASAETLKKKVEISEENLTAEKQKYQLDTEVLKDASSKKDQEIAELKEMLEKLRI